MKDASTYTYITFERSRDDMSGPTIGPFKYVQLTYNGLRVDEGDWIAYLGDDDWVIRVDKNPMSDFLKEHDLTKYDGEIWSDVIIFTTTEKLDLGLPQWSGANYDHKSACMNSDELETMRS